MKRGWLGIDAGGSQTRARVLTPEGRTGAGEAGPANWTTLGPEQCTEALVRAATQAVRAAELPVESLDGACVALAGYYPPWHEAEARASLGAALPVARLQIVPDLLAAWAGATGGTAGIVLVAGTGTVAYGRNPAGREARAGGWGPLFGDEGGGYWIGCEALRAISRALDGRGPDTKLRQELDAARDRAGSSAEALRGFYRVATARQQVAALSVGVTRHAAAGDQVAREILTRAAAELGALIAAVARRLQWESGPVPVSAVGGVMQAGPALCDPLHRWLDAVLPGARWKEPEGGPLDGALLLAMKEGPP